MDKKIATFEGSSKLYKDLRGRINKQAEDTLQAVTNVQNNIDKEKQDRLNADIGLQTKINETSDDLKQTIKTAETHFNQSLQEEISNRKTGDDALSAELQTKLQTATEKYNEVSQGLLNEATARQQQDKELLDKINAFKLSSDQALQQEVRERKAEDTKLSDAIAQEKQRATTAENNLATSIKQKTEDIQTNLDKETDDRKAADQALTDKITKEITDRTNEDKRLEGLLNTSYTAVNKKLTEEITNREAADTQLQTNIEKVTSDVDLLVNTKVTELEAADKALKASIDAEVSDRKTAIKEVNKSIDNEGKTRKLEDDKLSGSISNIQKVIPNSASEYNQLADKSFVNSSISNIAAVFKGNFPNYDYFIKRPWTETDETSQYYVTNNDYAIVENDETHNGQTWRYIYTKDKGWSAQYKLNDTPFTQAQLDAINSTITKSDVDQIGVNKTTSEAAKDSIGKHIANSDNPHNVTKKQLGLENVNNTSDADKPISNATQTVLDNISNTSLDHIRSRNNPHEVTKEQVGLGNADNTSDKQKPVSDAQKEAIDKVQYDIDLHKNDVNNPHNVTKEQLRLSNVDNTSDLNKPLSYATISALAEKAPIVSPILTGIPETPTPADTAQDNQIANVKFVKNQLGASGAVSFKLQQDLTAIQRKTARENIDAMEATHAQSRKGFGIIKLTDTLNFPLHDTIYGSFSQTGTPRPDALCEVDFVKGKLYTVSKNICPKAISTEIDGVSFTVNKDNSIEVSGVAAEDIDYAISVGYLPRAMYTISGCPTGGGINTYSLQFNLFHGNEFITGVTNEGPLFNSYIDTGLYPTYDTYRIIIHVVKGQTLDGVVFTPQLELGDLPTLYEGQGKLNNPLELPLLRAIHIGEKLPESIYTNAQLFAGVYDIGEITHNYYIADTWSNSEETVATRNNVIVHRIKELVLTGEEDFTYNTVTPGKERFQLVINDAATDNSMSLLLCNGFNATSYDKLATHEEDNIIAIESELNYDCIAIYSTRFDSVQSLKTQLRTLYNAGNPIIVYYITDQPTKTIDAAIAIDSYDNITVTYCDNKVEPYIVAAYSANIWALLEEQTDRVAQIKDAVLYEPQVHTEFQKQQARVNIGLGNVDNTSDADKPMSTAVKNAIANKQDTITAIGLLKRDESGNIVSAVSGVDYAPPTLVTEGVLEAAKWEGKQYSFEDIYPVNLYDLSIELSSNATDIQMQAAYKANMLGSATTNILTAYGAVPTIDIPIIVKVVKK